MSDRTQSQHRREHEEKSEVAVIVATFDKQREKYEGLLPPGVDLEAFRNAFLVAVQSNWKLLQAPRDSLWLALQKCAQDGLLPDGREAALSIFNDDDEDGASGGGKVKKVVYMPMIQGLIKLVRNTGEVASIDVPLVYRGEKVELWWEDGDKHFKLHRNFDENFDDSPTAIIGAVAIVTYKDGSWEMEPMSRKRIDRVRAVSKAKKGPWLAWYDEMARKTVLRNLLKRLPKSATLKSDKAFEKDETMDTIEGEGVEEIPGVTPALAAPDPMQEFSSTEISRQLAEAQQREAALVETRRKEEAAANTLAQTVSASQSRKPGAAPVPAAKEPSPPPFDVYPQDEIGEPIDSEDGFLRFLDPQAFAAWFVEKWGKSPNREALLENNADAIEDASNADQLARRMLANCKEPQEAKPPVEDQRVEYAAPPLDFVEMPLTPGGKPHWPNYLDKCKAILDTLMTEGEVNAWIAANEKIYKAEPKGMHVERAASARLIAVAPKASSADKDRVQADRMLAEVSAMKGNSEMSVWSQNTGNRTVMARWRQERPELFDEVDRACAIKVQSFGAPVADDGDPGAQPE